MSWQILRAEFEGLLEATPAERAARLTELARADAALARDLSDLLEHDAEAHGYLERPTRQPLRTMEAAAPAAGLQLGRYRLVRALGVGGMGEVWEASQEAPARRVALKILHSFAWTRAERWRFEHEAEVLAGLSHPSIAQLYETGSTPAGSGELSWIAMELVEDARDLVSWADETGAGRDQRLALFHELCAAVQHGHLRGIIHRDLKPANILVGRDGRLKLIDFGVARAVAGAAAAPVLRTQTGALIGTLQYMAPEQFSGRAGDVDVRCDVYALGVVLYRLLCGTHPFDLAHASLADMARIACSEEPIRPSVHVPALAGDLDWILLKALAKEPARRYQSVVELVEDLRRHRAHEPVLARAPSTWYRLTKLVRRRRRAVVVAASLLAGVAVALVGLWTGLERARTGETAARLAAIDAKEQARLARQQEAIATSERLRAEDEARHSRAVLTLVEGLFESLQNTVQGRDVRVADVLDAAPRPDPAQAGVDPRVEFAVGVVRATAYVRLELFAEARSELERALQWYERIEPERADPVEQAWARVLLGRCMTKLGEPEEGERLMRGAIAAAEALGAGETSEKAEIELLHYLNDKGANAELLERAERLRGLADERGHGGIALAATRSIALALQGLGRSAEAVPVLADAWQKCRTNLGEKHRATIGAFFNYVNALYESKQLDEAEELYPQVTQMAREVLGPAHTITLVSMNNHAAIAFSRRNYAEAARRLEPLVQAYDARGRPPSWDQLLAINNLGMALNQMRDFEKAEPYLRRAASMGSELLAKDDLNAVQFRFNHGACLAWMKRWSEAEPILLENLERLQALLPAGHQVLAKALRTMADAYAENGFPEEAKAWRAPR